MQIPITALSELVRVLVRIKERFNVRYDPCFNDAVLMCLWVSRPTYFRAHIRRAS